MKADTDMTWFVELQAKIEKQRNFYAMWNKAGLKLSNVTQMFHVKHEKTGYNCSFTIDKEYENITSFTRNGSWCYHDNDCYEKDGRWCVTEAKTPIVTIQQFYVDNLKIIRKILEIALDELDNR
jgi:hypothetical protein